jgi:ribose transport system substrate-binding protein
MATGSEGRRWWRRAISAVALLALVALASACGSSDSSSTGTSAAAGGSTSSESTTTDSGGGGSKEIPKITIGYLEVQGASPAAIKMNAELKRAAGVLGWDVKTVDSQADPAKMAAGAQGFVTQGVDAILTQSVAPAAINQALTQAKAKGIPAIQLGGPNLDPNKLYATTDAPSDEEMSKVITQAMIDDLGGKGDIVAQLFPSNEATATRDRTMKEMIAQSDVKLVASHDIDLANPIQDSRSSLLTMVRANPSTKALWADLDFEFAAGVQALKSINREDVKVYSFYANPDSVAALRKGGSAAAVVDSPVQNGGWIAVDQLLHYFVDKKPIEQDPFYADQFPIKLVTSENVPATGDGIEWPDLEPVYVKRWQDEGFDVSGS